LSDIDTFFNWFEDLANSATKISKDKYAPTFKRLIYVSALDSLSKCVAGKKFRVRERFVFLVKHFCEWPESSKVSLPHLVKFLQEVPLPAFEDLRKFAYEKYDSLEQGTTYTVVDIDPEKNDILKLWPRDSVYREPIEKIGLESLTHLNLLWKYRNALVHDTRRLGGMDSFDFEEPSYHSLTDLTIDPDPVELWELVYPVPFFEKLLRSAIKKLKTYYVENRLNPYDRFKLGSYWIEELN